MNRIDYLIKTYLSGKASARERDELLNITMKTLNKAIKILKSYEIKQVK